MIGRACTGCCFWHYNGLLGRENIRLGQCRLRGPHSFARRDGSPITRWPLTEEGDWCGEHAVFDPEPPA